MKYICVSLSNFPYLVTLSLDERNKTWISYRESIQFALCNPHVIDSYLRAESCMKESPAKDCILAPLLYPEQIQIRQRDVGIIERKTLTVSLLCIPGCVLVVADKIIFSHKPKNMAILTDLYSPLHRPSHVERSVAGTGNSFEEKLRGVERGQKKKVDELGYLSWAGRRSNPSWIVEY